MDRGSARAPDGRQPLARAAPSRVRRIRRGGSDPGRGGHILPRPRRLCAHAWRPGGGDDDGDGPRAVSGSYLSQLCHFRLTNKTPAATYRAPGRFEGTVVRERLIDAVADRLGLDRVTVRRRNLIAAAEMPFDRSLAPLATGSATNSATYPQF